MNQREIQKYEVVKDDSNDGADFACTQPSYAIACRAAVIVYAAYNRALDEAKYSSLIRHASIKERELDKEHSGAQ